MKSREAARRPPHDNNHVSTPEDGNQRNRNAEPSFKAWERHRQRQVQRLAAIATLLGHYGPAAELLSPPGPECCPRTCTWCHPRAVVA